MKPDRRQFLGIPAVAAALSQLPEVTSPAPAAAVATEAKVAASATLADKLATLQKTAAVTKQFHDTASDCITAQSAKNFNKSADTNEIVSGDDAFQALHRHRETVTSERAATAKKTLTELAKGTPYEKLDVSQFNDVMTNSQGNPQLLLNAHVDYFKAYLEQMSKIVSLQETIMQDSGYPALVKIGNAFKALQATRLAHIREFVAKNPLIPNPDPSSTRHIFLEGVHKIFGKLPAGQPMPDNDFEFFKDMIPQLGGQSPDHYADTQQRMKDYRLLLQEAGIVQPGEPLDFDSYHPSLKLDVTSFFYDSDAPPLRFDIGHTPIDRNGIIKILAEARYDRELQFTKQLKTLFENVKLDPESTATNVLTKEFGSRVLDTIEHEIANRRDILRAQLEQHQKIFFPNIAPREVQHEVEKLERKPRENMAAQEAKPPYEPDLKPLPRSDEAILLHHREDWADKISGRNPDSHER